MELKNPCVNCQKRDGSKHRIFDIVLCQKCKERPKYTLICKTNAKTSYHLTEKDLAKITNWFEATNPHFKCASNMKLCTQADARRVACRKYECTNGELDEICENMTKQKKNNRMMEPQNLKREIRRLELVNALSCKGLELSSDSKLCDGYIDGTITNWTVDAIVERMCQVKYLFDYCHLGSYFDKAYKIKRSSHALDSLFDIAERLALKDYGPYPKFYPWMNN
jgi:hypothetical protein